MNDYNSKQYVELFHLLFLDQLSKKLDKKLYVLKGGANLRYYFTSIRYSEDVDLDVRIISKETLSNKVNGILKSVPFQHILLARGMTILNVSSAKQTNTTQRWKLVLQTPNSTLPTHTKIEFSRRNFEQNDGMEFAVIDVALLQMYQLAPIMLNHYSAQAACLQKITALADRNQTQARDVFDIYLLLTSYGQKIGGYEKFYLAGARAQKCLASLSFQDYQSQVISYLAAEYQNHYNSVAVWQDIVNRVKTFLEANCAPH